MVKEKFRSCSKGRPRKSAQPACMMPNQDSIAIPATRMPRTDQEILNAFLDQRQPGRMLLIGRDASALLSEWCEKNTQCDVTVVSELNCFQPASIVEAVDFALLAGELSQCPRQVLEPIIAGLRDRYSRQLLVRLDNEDRIGTETPGNAPLNPQDLRALGLRRMQGSQRLFQFNLDSYKHNPDWLNSRFWANPDQWNKRRW